jgi:hypothetical protein
MGKIRLPVLGSNALGFNQGRCGSHASLGVWGKNAYGSKSGDSDSRMRWM